MIPIDLLVLVEIEEEEVDLEETMTVLESVADSLLESALPAVDLVSVVPSDQTAAVVAVLVFEIHLEGSTCVISPLIRSIVDNDTPSTWHDHSIRQEWKIDSASSLLTVF